MPVAFAIAFDVSFSIMQKEFFKLGRKRFEGTNSLIWRPYIYKCGKIYKKEIQEVKVFKGMTCNNFDDYYPRGVYIAGVRGHLLTIVNGIPEDWTENRFNRIEQGRLFKIGKSEELKINKKPNLKKLLDLI